MFQTLNLGRKYLTHQVISLAFLMFYSTKLWQKGLWQMTVWMQNIPKVTDHAIAKCFLLFVTTRLPCPLQWPPDYCLASGKLQREEEKAMQSERNSTFSILPMQKKRGENRFFSEGLHNPRFPEGSFWLVFQTLYMDLYCPLLFLEGDNCYGNNYIIGHLCLLRNTVRIVYILSFKNA